MQSFVHLKELLCKWYGQVCHILNMRDFLRECLMKMTKLYSAKIFVNVKIGVLHDQEINCFIS